MATTTPNKRKKLYFDFAITGSATRQIFPVTQFRAGVTCPERFGGFLDALEALTASSNAGAKARNEVSAWAMIANKGDALAAVTIAPVMIDFIGPTSGNGPGGITRLPYLTVGGNNLGEKCGQSAIFGTAGVERHFAIRVRRGNVAPGGSTSTVRGVLYVARQHSIEV
ncbi:MAG: hypothetical protein JO277_08930 [Candidatus Eremiobacteraeota bacterium]|nr:hypothetical protein [Candidatus Eremiobacteraeota bacterium]